MANYTGAVRFDDGKVLFFSYAGTTDIARRNLFASDKEVTHQQDALVLPVPIADDSPVEVIPYYMHGNQDIAFTSRASRSLMVITGPVSWDEMQREHDAKNGKGY